MSEEMEIDGKQYISSKRASVISGYAQDYIGQLARKSLIEARRIGGLWYVSMESLDTYKQKAAEFKPEPPARIDTKEPSALVFFDGKEYLSASRAAEESGYTQDYVGQLARSGTLLSQQVGNRWYVERQSLLSHKKEKDALLGAVQSESVGIQKRTPSTEHPEYLSNDSYSGSGPLLNYVSDEGDLMPVTMSPEDEHETAGASLMNVPEEKSVDNAESQEEQEQLIPIRRIPTKPVRIKTVIPTRYVTSQGAQKSRLAPMPLLLAAAATIVIVVSAGYASTLKQNSVYSVAARKVPALSALSASVDTAFEEIADLLEPLLTRELVYQRPNSQ